MFSSSIDSRRSARAPAGGAVSAWGAAAARAAAAAAGAGSQQPASPTALFLLRALEFPLCTEEPPPPPRLPPSVSPLPPPSTLSPPPPTLRVSLSLHSPPSGSRGCFNASDASTSPPSLPGVWYSQPPAAALRRRGPERAARLGASGACSAGSRSPRRAGAGRAEQQAESGGRLAEGAGDTPRTAPRAEVAAAWMAGESEEPQPRGSLRSRGADPLGPFPPCPELGTRRRSTRAGREPWGAGCARGAEPSVRGRAGPPLSRGRRDPALGRAPGHCLLSRTHTCQVAHRAALCLLGRREGLRESAATRRLPRCQRGPSAPSRRRVCADRASAETERGKRCAVLVNRLVARRPRKPAIFITAGLAQIEL